jgi:hypothetical protein
MSDEFKDLYQIRDAVLEDKNFILATFLRGLYYGDFWYGEIPKDIFMNSYKIIAESLIHSSNVIIKVACDPEAPSVVYGYSILSPDFSIVHWVYVKKIWRMKGIGKSLTPQHPRFATHLSKLGKSLMSKYKDFVFNPFTL